MEFALDILTNVSPKFTSKVSSGLVFQTERKFQDTAARNCPYAFSIFANRSRHDPLENTHRAGFSPSCPTACLIIQRLDRRKKTDDLSNDVQVAEFEL